MKMLQRRVLVAALAMVGLVAPRAGAAQEKKHKIVTTTGMVTDIVRVVAGEKAEVQGIIGEGIDPHLYQATRSDIAKLLEADLIFYNGLMLEGKMADALIKVARKRPVFPVTELIDEKLLLEPPEFAGHFDPHVWMDTTLWSKAAEAVATALADHDPTNADYYKQNYAVYATELERLDGYAKNAFASIPEKSRVLITAHDAFNYLGQRYGIEVKGIQGISTESEAGISDINRLVDLIVERDIKAVFVETSVSDKNVESLIEGARARGHEVRIGGKLFSDAMGRPGSYEGTYIGMIDHNVTTIVRALGGDAPARGVQGKLAAE